MGENKRVDFLFLCIVFSIDSVIKFLKDATRENGLCCSEDTKYTLCYFNVCASRFSLEKFLDVKY